LEEGLKHYNNIIQKYEEVAGIISIMSEIISNILTTNLDLK